MLAPRLLSFCRDRRVLLSLLILVALALGAPQAWAWYQLRSARSALERYHPEQAQTHLARCLRVWPHSLQAHLLASRAARQSGDTEEAERQIRACQRLLESTNAEVALEWALLQASSGNVREVEDFLQRAATEGTEASRLVWEAMAEGYIRLYRILDALACLDHWLAVDPDNSRALELRGLAYFRGKAAHKGSADLRRVIDRDPTRDAARWRLVLCLLEMGAYDEALTHLEYVQRQRPDDPEVLVRLARCHNMLDRGEQARQILDGVLEAHPEHMLALRMRGQFALTDREPQRAERWLRRAAAVSPNDYQTHWLLVQALHQQKKTAEAQQELKLAESIKDRSERLGELRSRKMSEQPLDPALHCEMGILLDARRQQGSRRALAAQRSPARCRLPASARGSGGALRARRRQRTARLSIAVGRSLESPGRAGDDSPRSTGTIVPGSPPFA